MKPMGLYSAQIKSNQKMHVGVVVVVGVKLVLAQIKSNQNMHVV